MEKKEASDSKLKAKKRAILIIVVALLVLIVFIIMLIWYAKLKESEDIKKNVREYENAISKVDNNYYANGQIVPENDNKLARLYEGTVYDEVMYEKIYGLVENTIPNINNNLGNLSDEELTNYYTNNENRVKQSIGSETVEEFISFVRYIEEMNPTGFEGAKYDVALFEDGENYALVPLKLEYKNKTITIKMYIAKRNGEKVLIMFKN